MRRNLIFQLAFLASFSQKVSSEVIFTNPKVAWNPIFYLKHFKRIKSISLTGKSVLGYIYWFTLPTLNCSIFLFLACQRASSIYISVYKK